MRRLLVLVCPLALLYAADTKRPQPPKLNEESLTQEKFSEIHAPILQPTKQAQPGALTESVAKSLPAGAAGSQHIARRNFIDNQIFGKMERDRIPHAGLASDQEFLRRVSLDLAGRIPSAQDIREFTASTDPAKPDNLIDKLLASDDFVNKWAYFFMDVFRANGKMGRGQDLFHYWMKENLSVDRPYDDIARDIIASSAKSNHVVAASNVIAREHVQGKPQPDDGHDMGMVHQMDTHDEVAVLFNKVFLGINTSCISCHDGKGHLEKVNVYLSTRKRTEFYGNAAFMGNSRYLMYWEEGKPQSGEFLIDDGNPGYDSKGKSMIRVPRFGGAAAPSFMLTGEKPRAGVEPRVELGRMLTAHPQFARATVNLFWAKLMGQGIVEPYDEFDLARQDPGNLPAGWDLQPSHPELLKELAASFRQSNHSIKSLFRTITRSSAYQLSARFDGEWKESYSKYFARKFVRQLGAEEIHDSIAVATSRPGAFKRGKETMPMAMQVSGPAGSGDVKTFMAAFGQSNRSNPPKDPTGSPLQPLLMMQSGVINDRVIAEKDSRVQRLLDTYATDDGKVVEELFISTLSRWPTEGERGIALAAMKPDRRRGAQNLQWALLNQVEFLFNY